MGRRGREGREGRRERGGKEGEEGGPRQARGGRPARSSSVAVEPPSRAHVPSPRAARHRSYRTSRPRAALGALPPLACLCPWPAGARRLRPCSPCFRRPWGRPQRRRPRLETAAASASGRDGGPVASLALLLRARGGAAGEEPCSLERKSGADSESRDKERKRYVC